MVKSIFVVEDEPEIRSLLSHILAKDDYIVYPYATGEEALKEIESRKPDLVLLDIILPGISGLDVCERLKNNPETWNIPIIMLTSRSYEFDIITGLNTGGDDYITKPFSERVLSARIKAALRREERKKIGDKNTVIQIKDLVIDSKRFEVSVKSKIITFTASEFKLLSLLAKNEGIVFSRDQIFDILKGCDSYYGDRSIDILIGRIRKKLGSYGKFIESIYGVGYRFKEFKEDENYKN